MARKAPTPESDEQPETLANELRGLMAEARTAFGAEVAYQSARASLAGRIIARMAGLVALALALVFFVLMALVVGTLLALGPVLSPWGALAAVLLVLVLAIGLAALGIKAGLRRLKRLFASDGSGK